MSTLTIDDLNLPEPGNPNTADVWATRLNDAFGVVVDAVNDRVDDAELAAALEGQLASIRQLPAIGENGQVLAVVAGAPAYVDLPSSGGDYPPVGGIPKTDLAAAVQASLDKADSALQSIPSSYTTDAELAAAIEQITLASLGAQPAGSYASAADLDNVFQIASAAAPLADAHLTGVPTAPTAALGTNSQQIATMAAVKQAVDALVADAPGALDTLKEIADALAADDSELAALTTSIGTKVPQTRTINGDPLSADINLTPAKVGAAAASHTHTAGQISDATTVGLALMKAADAPAARSAIGAGTSSLALGTSSSTAKAGDWKPATADISDAGSNGAALLKTTTPSGAQALVGLYPIAAGGATAGIPTGSVIVEALS